MRTGIFNITDIWRGDSWDVTFRLRNADGTYKDLSGLVALAQYRAPDDTLLGTFTVSVFDQTVEATRGAFMLSLTPAQTALLPTNASAVWDVEFSNAGRTFVYTPLTGTMTWDGDVSRP